MLFAYRLSDYLYYLAPCPRINTLSPFKVAALLHVVDYYEFSVRVSLNKWSAREHGWTRNKTRAASQTFKKMLGQGISCCGNTAIPKNLFHVICVTFI